MIEQDCCRESMGLSHLFRWIRYKIRFRAEHPDYFDPDGLVIFVGPQGSGKSLSAVNYVYKLMAAYPESKLVTNLMLRDFPIVTYEDYAASAWPNVKDEDLRDNVLLFKQYVKHNRVFPFNNNDDFSRYFNGECGVVFLVDEIQLYMNSLESRNINIDVVTQISQQRKQRKHIVATSQVFGRMAKPLREQFSNVLLCGSFFGCLQMNQLIDRDSLDSEESTGTNISGKVKKKFFWWRDPDYFDRYDTYYVIDRNKFVSGEKQKKELMEVV